MSFFDVKSPTSEHQMETPTSLTTSTGGIVRSTSSPDTLRTERHLNIHELSWKHRERWIITKLHQTKRLKGKATENSKAKHLYSM